MSVPTILGLFVGIVLFIGSIFWSTDNVLIFLSALPRARLNRRGSLTTTTRRSSSTTWA